MKQANGTLAVRAPRPGLFEITGQLQQWLDSARIGDGLLTIFCAHTSASLLIQENAAPAARRDLEAYFARIAPQGESLYTHDDEGPDDMPAHLRTALTQTQLAVPVRGGRLALGTWQGVFLFEHRNGTPQRRIELHLVGEGE
ncbi:YjbQ family protein [Sphingomonas sabuli]|uniref:YjbQ family protein n=1 Tax=Sphingomonas sabuli TaxID=2764186 RepID=A0A7G9L5P8_9SPHN|nr:YjbQ family protein [Sphingomonas sabuli]